MKYLLKVSLFFIFSAVFERTLCASVPFYVSFPVFASSNDQNSASNAPKNAGVTLVRWQIANQAAYQIAGPDGPGAGRIYTKTGQFSYVLADVGDQWSAPLQSNQTILAVVEAAPGTYTWNGPAFSGAQAATLTASDLASSRLMLQGMTLTAVPVPALVQGDPAKIILRIPAFDDRGGQAIGLELWRQGSDGLWQALASLPLSPSAQVYSDNQVQAGASYWYGTSIIYGWPGGAQAGAIPTSTDQFVGSARSQSGLMVASKIQPTPTFAPTLTPVLNHDLGKAGWAAGPNPSRDGHFRIEFQITKPAMWHLRAFGLDGTLVKQIEGNSPVVGWQVESLDLSKLASGVYFLDLRVTQEGEAEKTLDKRKVAIIR